MGARGGGEAVMTELRLRLVPDPALLAPTRRAIRRWAEENDVGGERLERLLLACGEALANSIEHTPRTGRRISPSVTLAGEPTITLDLWLDEHGRVVARIRDRGPWRESGSDGPGFRGRGLALMRRAMGRVEVDRAPEGTVVTLVEDAPGPAAFRPSPGRRRD